MAVFVLDRKQRPLMPCSEKRARLLLARGRARVHRLTPFVIRLVDRQADASAFQPVELLQDPGSRVTGMAIARVSDVLDVATGEVQRLRHALSLVEVVHRGAAIREALTQRAGCRRRRRGNLRFRAPRFSNRTRAAGALAPSLQHRVDTIAAWVRRFRRWVPITAIAQELVRFDMQRMVDPEISGVAYQQGTLAGYEVREYLLEKYGRRCVYCGETKVRLEIEHLTPVSRKGSNRISNLAIACCSCNREKGNRTVAEYVTDPVRAARITAQATMPLHDAAAVNTTQRALLQANRATGLPVATASGGRTKWNRTRFGLVKTHALDALCVGDIDGVEGADRPTLAIKATGRGSYQRTRLTAHGFPRGVLMRRKQVHGFQTGDRVSASVPFGKKAGTYVGRVAVRASGSFNIQTASGVVQGISYRYCILRQRADGYGYQHSTTQLPKASPGEGTLSLPGLKAGVSCARQR